MHLAVLHGHKEAYQQLYQLGGDPALLNKEGFSPFTLAAKYGRKDLFNLMLEDHHPSDAHHLMPI